MTTLLISTKSLGLKEPKDFEQAVQEVSKSQEKFAEQGFELGFAHRRGLPNQPGYPDIAIQQLAILAKLNNQVPITFETEYELTADKDEIFSPLRYFLETARDFANVIYHGSSKTVRQRPSVRVLFGNYVKDGSIDDKAITQLQRNIKSFEDLCQDTGNYLLVENIPTDTPYLEELKQALLATNSYGERHVRFMIDTGNLTTKIDGNQQKTAEQAMQYMEQNKHLIGGYHLKQTKDGGPLARLRPWGQQEYDFNMKRLMFFIMSQGHHHPIVIEPVAKGYSLKKAIWDAQYLAKIVNGL